MENLRAAQEKDLADCIEGEFGDDIELTGPNGLTQTTNANDPTKNLRAKIRYKAIRIDPETGEPMIIQDPSASIRITSLTTVPADGENWQIKMPVSPEAGAIKENFLFTPDRAAEVGTDMGYIKLKPVKPVQI